jgi:hypothetical protein
VVLSPANAWGFREKQGVFNSGRFSKIRAILWAVKPVVNVAALSETDKFLEKKRAHAGDPLPEIRCKLPRRMRD